MPSPCKIAFFGIGLMGEPMARRLLQAGHPLTVWNRTTGKTAALTALGAQTANSPAAAVRDADLIVSMLGDGTAVAAVMETAMPALAPHALWIDMSSTRQAEALAFHATLTREGRRFIDAPVSGGVGGAAAGTLAIMAGGDAGDFSEAQPVFAALGKATLVGPAGSGQVAKLCNQLIVGATIAVVAEALLLAQTAGADPAAVRAAIRGGFAESRVLDVHGQRMLERNFIPGGQVKTQTKDMHNILAAADAAGLTLPLTKLVTAHYEAIVASHASADHSAALLALEALNPGRRLGDQPDRMRDEA